MKKISVWVPRPFVAATVLLVFFLNGEVSAQDLSPFQQYQPTYFGVTLYETDKSNEGEAVFQLSFKYDLIKSNLDKYFDLYFGYTQKSFWAIHEISQPFKETNYAPEIFLEGKRIKGLEKLQVGLARHESTGEAGAGSNGWNISYLELSVQHNLFNGNLAFVPRVWAPLFFQSKNETMPDNTDLFLFYGHGHIQITYDKNPLHHRLFLRQGTQENTLSTRYQLDTNLSNIPLLSKITQQFFNLNTNIFVQYWHGFGDSLKNYNQRTSRVVMGVSFIY